MNMGARLLLRKARLPLASTRWHGPMVHSPQVKANTCWLSAETPDTSESSAPDPYSQRCQVAQHRNSSVISGNLSPAVGAQHTEACTRTWLHREPLVGCAESQPWNRKGRPRLTMSPVGALWKSEVSRTFSLPSAPTERSLFSTVTVISGTYASELQQTSFQMIF